MNVPYLLAALWSLMIACVHTFVGGRTDLRPLLSSDVPEPAKSTLYFCWHAITIALFGISAMFGWSAAVATDRGPALFATIFAALLALWGTAASAGRRRSPFTELPQGLMFLVLAVLGIWGFFTS